jgi:hypothetical protein
MQLFDNDIVEINAITTHKGGLPPLVGCYRQLREMPITVTKEELKKD